MFPPGSPYVEQVASKVNSQVEDFCRRWQVSREVGQSIVKLALFDIILYIGQTLDLLGDHYLPKSQMTVDRWPLRRMASGSKI
jgi:hypothetical protein